MKYICCCRCIMQLPRCTDVDLQLLNTAVELKIAGNCYAEYSCWIGNCWKLLDWTRKHPNIPEKSIIICNRRRFVKIDNNLHQCCFAKIQYSVLSVFFQKVKKSKGQKATALLWRGFQGFGVQAFRLLTGLRWSGMEQWNYFKRPRMCI